MSDSHLPKARGACSRAALGLCLAATLSLQGCSGIEKAPPQATASRVEKSSIKLDVPEILRGTIASETVIRGYQAETSPGYRPIVAQGYGLVVGLKGTGSRTMAPQLRQYMLNEAAKGGFGRQNFGEQIASLTPEELLNSPNTSVVVVQAIVPQGAPAGTRFDVRVFAEPTTDTMSLEGGMLYTTMLRPGPLAMGGRQAFEIAKASGPIFINPFAEGDISTGGAVMTTSGRILNGGEILKDMPLKLQLANPSHTRATMLQSTINSVFPPEPGQRDDTARGESDDLIDITVPPSWGTRTEEFVKILLHMTTLQTNPEATAMYVRRTLLANPSANAEAASLRWQALGRRVLPMIKDLYDSAQELPRLAALRAGAKLDDGLVIPPLIEMAKSGSGFNRVQAITLLEDMRTNPAVDEALRSLLNDDDLEVRLRAYEALVQRNDPFMHRFDVDGKFFLDVVDSDVPLIYVTQIGHPRIAIFGKSLEISRPLTVSAWSNRFMLKGDSDQEEIEVYYRDAAQDQGVILRAKPALAEFVRFLGHKSSVERPEAGLNLSYGETVGALYQVWRQQRITADFKLEQDRILAAIRRIQTETEGEASERPELSATPVDATGADPSAAAGGSDLRRLGEARIEVAPRGPEALPGTKPQPATAEPPER